MFDYLIVGAGFAGCVLAERLSNILGKRVLIIEKRSHIGGNAFDYYNESGVLVHKYGPHIFHTNSKLVFEYLSQFTSWRHYQHRVLSYVDGQFVPFPINLDTINTIYGLQLRCNELEMYFDKIRERDIDVVTSEDVVVSQIGRDLFKKFFDGYTRKQWGCEASELDASVTRRVPVRISRDGRYFTDKYQGIPKNGYTDLFNNMLTNKNVSILLNTDYKSVIESIKFNRMIYTGPIDYFFDFMYGSLPYRSIEFEYETFVTEELNGCYYQPVGTVNYPNDYDFTRITEFKHLTGQHHHCTTIVKEYSKADGDPYYPVPNKESQKIYQKYTEEVSKVKSVRFLGRLANYSYLNMDQVVLSALEMIQSIIKDR